MLLDCFLLWGNAAFLFLSPHPCEINTKSMLLNTELSASVVFQTQTWFVWRQVQLGLGLSDMMHRLSEECPSPGRVSTQELWVSVPRDKMALVSSESYVQELADGPPLAAQHISLSLFWIMYYWTLSTCMRQRGRQVANSSFFEPTTLQSRRVPYQLSYHQLVGGGGGGGGVQIYTIQPKANLKGNVSVHKIIKAI